MYDLRKQWLKEKGFPDAPLYATSKKLEKCEKLGITHLVDDKPLTIQQLKGSGTIGVHFITPYAAFEPAGPHFITNLNQLKSLLW